MLVLNKSDTLSDKRKLRSDLKPMHDVACMHVGYTFGRHALRQEHAKNARPVPLCERILENPLG